MSTPESKVKRKINALLKNYEDIVYSYMPVPSGYGKRTVDYLLCVDGMFAALEAKPDGKQPTPTQSDVLAKVKRANGATFVVNDDESLRVFGNYLELIRRNKERTSTQ